MAAVDLPQVADEESVILCKYASAAVNVLQAIINDGLYYSVSLSVLMSAHDSVSK